MIDPKIAPVVTRFRLWLRTFITSGTTQRKFDRVRSIRPSLEALEDRTLLSAPAFDPLPVLSVASLPFVPSVTAVTSYTASLMNQWSNFIATVQQDAIGAWKAISQEIAQDVSFVEQQWDRFFGINPNIQNPAANSAMPQHSSGSGSGSGSSSGHDAPLASASAGNAPPIRMKPMGSGSGGSGGGHSGGGGGGGAIYVNLSSYTYSANESDGVAYVQVDLSASPSNEVTVNLITTDGSARSGIDYEGGDYNVVFQPNHPAQQTVAIPIFDDGSSDESVGSEWFEAQLANPTNATLENPSIAKVTILENSPPPPPPPPGPLTVGFSSSSYSITEGGTATITATLSSPSSQQVTVQYATSDGTASSSGTDGDYNAASGTLTFAPNATSASFSIATIEDNDQSSSSETVNLSLSNPVGANAGLMSSTFNINEPAPPPPPPPPPPPSIVKGTVWTDTNEDGIQQSGEPGKSGIAVTLAEETSPGVLQTYETTTTDASGNYQFQAPSDVAGLWFQIYVSIPAGSEATIENASATGTTSNIDDLGYSALFILGQQQTINAGLVTPSLLPVLMADKSNLCDCGCTNEAGSLEQNDDNTAVEEPSESTADPVRYADGVVTIAQTDLHSDGFGFPWGQTRSWTNGSLYTAGSDNGNGWVDTYTPRLIQADGSTNNTLIFIANGNTAFYFDLVNGVYQPRIDDGSQLTNNSSNDTYTLLDTQGDQIVFDGFGSSWQQIAQRGQFASFTSPGGVTMAVTAWTGDGHIAAMQRSGGTATESWQYSYISSGVNAGLLGGVALLNNGNVVRQVQYAYYDGSQNGGNVGDLMTAAVKDGLGNVVDTSYYRYYTQVDLNNGQAGYLHALKYVFNPASYERLTAAQGVNLSTMTDSQVDSYADNYFRYDSKQRVSLETVQGAGSSASGGLGTYTFSYTANNNSNYAPGYNSWAMKTVVGNPDGSTDTVYTNAYGEVLYDDFNNSGLHYDSFYLYNFNGQLVLAAAPSAVGSPNDGWYDLLNNSTGYEGLYISSGLVTRYDYYSATTATETTAGGVANHLKDKQIQRGISTPLILQESWQYYAHAYQGQTIAPLASDTVYRNDDGSGAETTSYAFTWYSNSALIQSETDTAPVVSAAENGPGTADATTIYYDQYGNAQWTKDPDGYIHYDAYDPATGALITDIADVDTSRIGEFSNLPWNWNTPAGGGLNLITQDQVDALGRTVKETSPAGNITYYVYLDSQHEERIYRGWNGTWAAEPTEVIHEDAADGYNETFTMTATPNLNNGVPNGSESPGNLQTLTRDYTNAAGQVTSEYAYYNLSGLSYNNSTMGNASNYYQTTYSYDSGGRLYQTQTPNGTLYQTLYDSLGQKNSDWVGTSTANLVEVASYQYDHDGNLTQAIDYPGLNAANRETDSWYDWRDRLVAQKSGVESNENDGVNRPIVVTSYDNLDQVVQTQQYVGDGVTPVIAYGVLQPTFATESLRAQENDSYDEQGRLYQTQVFDVNPSTGNVGGALTSNSYYDHRGDLIAQSNPGGLWTKSQYDGVGRDVMDDATDGMGGVSWTAASSVANDTVLEQEQKVYDGDGNVVETIDSQRFHNATGTGPLGTPSSGIGARVYYAANYYDNADRLIASVDAGTNGGTAWTRPSSAPASSPTLLVTSYAYNAMGLVQDVTDPMGLVTRTLYDNLGRTTKTIQDYTGGTPGNESDVTTEYGYDGDNNVTYVQANEPGGSYQQTKYIYGVTTSGGSGVNSNDILFAIQHPDPSSGQPSGMQQDTYLTNALGQEVWTMDRNSNVHQYGYDVLGRLTSDNVSSLGYGVDGAVRQLSYGYDGQGNLSLISSLDATGHIVNQVQRVYNGLGQLTGDYQAHSGGVNPGSTPQVKYAYNEMADGGNNSRLMNMTYPNGYVLNYNYNSISQLTSLYDSYGTVESYLYLGLNTVVERDHPIVSGGSLNLSYIQQSGDMQANTDGGDQYTGLDRFGRVIDQYWFKTAGMGAGPVERFQYGYNQDSEVLYRDNLLQWNMGELYQYDNVGQLVSFQRGTLNVTHSIIVGSPLRTQSWSPDALGNFSSVTTNGATQTRTVNQQNEYSIFSDSGWISYDANGNLTADGKGNTYVYDAWNRLVTVQNNGNTVASYGYDGLNRQIQVTENGATTDLYYSSQDQVLAEYQNGAWSAYNVWSPVYVNALVSRAVNEGTHWQLFDAVQDANWDVTALLNGSGGLVVERYAYDPYGAVSVFTGQWQPQSTSTYDVPNMWQGMRYDWATNLYFTEAERVVSPTLMRPLQLDPLGQGPDVNPYRWQGDGPINHVDPTGLEWVWPWDPRASWKPEAVIDLWTGGYLTKTSDPFAYGPVTTYTFRPGENREPAGGTLIPTPENLDYAVRNLMKAAGYSDEKITEFEIFMNGPVADPRYYTPDGRYFGPEYGMPPLLGRGLSGGKFCPRRAVPKALAPTSRSSVLGLAKDRAGVPRSQQPTRQWRVGEPKDVRGSGVRDANSRNQGIIYEYEIPKPGGGMQKVYIIDHGKDPIHGGIGHVHTGKPKPGASSVEPGGRYTEIGEPIPYENR